jgi:hypothetical protein
MPNACAHEHPDVIGVEARGPLQDLEPHIKLTPDALQGKATPREDERVVLTGFERGARVGKAPFAVICHQSRPSHVEPVLIRVGGGRKRRTVAWLLCDDPFEQFDRRGVVGFELSVEPL